MSPEKPWRAEAVIQFCAAQFACLCLGILAAASLQKLGVAGFRHDGDFGNVLLGTLSFQGAAWVLMLFFLRQHQVGWRDAFGFHGNKIAPALAMALVVVVVILPIAFALEYASTFMLTKIGRSPEDQAAVILLVNAKPCWARAYLGFFAVVLAPVAEEFFFRGMLFPFVKQRGWPRLAWFGVSALFALIHFDADIFAPLFVFALALTWLYERTNNLLAPIAAHALFNAVNLAVLCFQGQLNQLLQKLCQFLHLA
jgi:membrane protease YdiL (CAAX protease family)